MSNGNGHHYSKFVWRDWCTDSALRMCGPNGRSVWMEMLCVMFDATPVGHLLVSGKQPTTRQLAVLFGLPEKIVSKGLAELAEHGVFSRTADGTIYSRRMVKDAAATEAGREHIAKRWNGHAKTPDPPNRGPIREPTREATREPTSQAYRFPITKSHSTDSDLESRERKEEVLKTLTLPLPTRDRARGEQAGEDEKPARIDRTNDAPPAADPLVRAHIQRAADAIKMRVPYGEVRSREEQEAALEAQPEVDEAMGMAWQPAAPVSTLEQQIAAATAGASPEQLERARIAFAARAGGYAASPMAAAQ